MDKGLWIAKKNLLCVLIKSVSDQAAGDNIEFLRDYCEQVVEKHRDDLETAVECFKSLLINVECEAKIKINPNFNICRFCKYSPPFCLCK